MNRILARPLFVAARWLRDWAMYLIGATEGPATCCGCRGRVINVARVDENLLGKQTPGEAYCWECWYARPILCDHIELPRPIVDTSWREADRIVSGLIADRERAA
jgi:hypothetical protein